MSCSCGKKQVKQSVRQVTKRVSVPPTVKNARRIVKKPAR